MIAKRFRVTGRVQGVAFRWSTAGVAQRLGISGWVRNVPDGSVEGWAEGTDAAMEEFAAWLRDGPPAARVSELTLEDAVARGADGFEIRS